ncbi:related to DNA repair protein rad9 [Sporisorium scitamineum]|uniref:Related to DNA repair protein rad9 n=1 Tax=Sporisorium scitamineum TaxID=49012 RepID=A0A127Z4N5_9BASI|nr:related to DNA repair protein rad9 [Sporisorium scitamineum]
MNALISTSDIKTFYSALHCLGRFSETFWLQCSPRINGQAQIRLSAINSTNSAFCMFAFDPDFFLNVQTESNQKIECQIQLKTILSILRTRGRNVERLSLTLTTTIPCRFTLTLHCHHSILKTHHLTYEPKRGLLPTADPNPPHFFCINASTASEWLDHFLSTSRTGEITLLCTPTTCIARSKEEELLETRGSVRKAIATEVKVAVEEFREYCVLEEVRLTFSLREFKATVALAEGWGVALEVNFSDGDEPLFVRLRVESAVAAEFVIATTKGDRSGTGRGEGESSTVQQPPQPAAAGTRIAASITPSHTNRSSTSNPSNNHSSTSQPSNTTTAPNPTPLPTNQSTPLPLPHPPPHHQGNDNEDATQPLFFPGASQLSLQPSLEQTTELAFVHPTPVAQGGDPGEFLHPQPSQLSQVSQVSQGEMEMEMGGRDSDDDSDTEKHDGGPRKRFKPLF